MKRREFITMKRREFITLLGGAAVTPSFLWPLAARAQQPMPVIGFLNSASSEFYAADRQQAFRQGLSETGYVEGRNVTAEYRWADNQNDRLPALAAELVRRQVTVIVTNGPSVLVVKAATTTIPIVFFTSGDPVELGLVASLNRPGGNLTGVSNLGTELGPKGLELLHELVPTATVLSLLVNPTYHLAETQSRATQAAAHTLGLKLNILHADTERDFDAVFAALAQMRSGGLVIGADPFFNSGAEQLAALAARHAVPTVSLTRNFAAAGGLMSYGGSLTDAWRLMGGYTGRILKGEKPADLPVQQSAKIELIVNLKAAKALGITVPHALLLRADEVIE